MDASVDSAVKSLPHLVSATPLQFSRLVSSEITLTGANLDKIDPAATWTFPGCHVQSVTGHNPTPTTYQLTIVPDSSKAAVGDFCPLHFQQAGVVETIAGPFVTML